MSESEDLKAELARLSARIAELETQLAAKPPIDRASLYRMANNAPWGVLVVGVAGAIEFANTAFQRWLLAPAPATGQQPDAVVAPTLWSILEPRLAGALTGVSHTAEQAFADASGEIRTIKLEVFPRGGELQGITGAVVVIYDLTETAALDRTLRESEARLKHINAVTPSIIYIFDVKQGLPVWAGGRVGQILTRSIEELAEHGSDAAGQLVHPADRRRIIERIREMAALPDGEVREVECRIRRRDGSYRWVLDRAVVFERDAAGQVVKTLSAAIDIDERKRAEERRTMLIHELNHRVKNTLAAVQSIARQTLSAGRPNELAFDLFTDRLIAMSAAHDVLTRENWAGAGLREIAAGALSPFQANGEGRIAINGPDVRLSARAALALAMALHELATNAAKYGALSCERGSADLSWRLRPDGDRDALELVWRETGGPQIKPPSRSGFGSRLLTQGLPAELRGAAELDFAPHGLVCRISMPLEAGPFLEPA